MIMDIIELLVVIAGLLVTFILFFRFPGIPKDTDHMSDLPAISVIIPTRNEEKNIGLLLNDLKNQFLPPDEIICVDDSSEDGTVGVMLPYDVKLIALRDKPNDWIGKSWACQNGADSARNKILLFLDADVRLGPNAIRRLLETYIKLKCPVSVQPYHKPVKIYEQLSIIFNLVQIAANGTALRKQKSIGLYGPVILISSADYIKAGGHKSVKGSIAEDIALGSCLRKAGIPYRLFIGDKDISFRMYGHGFRSFLQGWTKNIATGALKTPPLMFFMIFLWITSLASVPIHLAVYIINGNNMLLSLYIILYFIWALVLFITSRYIGNFRISAVIFHPFPASFLIGIFICSLFKKLFRIKSTWKGRKISSEEK